MTLALRNSNMLIDIDVDDFVNIVLIAKQEQEKIGVDPEILKNS